MSSAVYTGMVNPIGITAKGTALAVAESCMLHKEKLEEVGSEIQPRYSRDTAEIAWCTRRSSRRRAAREI